MRKNNVSKYEDKALHAVHGMWAGGAQSRLCRNVSLIEIHR